MKSASTQLNITPILQKKQPVPDRVLNHIFCLFLFSVMDHGIHLVVSSNSFVSRGHKQPIRPVLTVQEKLTQEVPSLPPQVKIYTFLHNTAICHYFYEISKD